MNNDAASQAKVPGSESLSQLAARILDQLSVSSWLPSGILVLVVMFFGSIMTHGGEVDEAVAGTVSIGFAELIAVLGLIVVTTVLTQAFEFEAIRFLEGYWGSGTVTSRLAARSCRCFIRRRQAWLDQLDDLTVEAALSAAPAVRGLPIVSQRLGPVIEALHDERCTDERAGAALAHLCDDHRNLVESAAFEPYALPHLVRRCDALSARLQLLPTHDHRVLPTKLGNVLRSFEDPVARATGHDIERFVQLNADRFPPALLVEHHQFRSRLDLYCSLVFVWFGLALLASVLLVANVAAAAVAAVACVLLTGFSYRAAIASAKGWGATLLSMRDIVGRPLASATIE